jgi:hypothetical protein
MIGLLSHASNMRLDADCSTTCFAVSLCSRLHH